MLAGTGESIKYELTNLKMDCDLSNLIFFLFLFS